MHIQIKLSIGQGLHSFPFQPVLSDISFFLFFFFYLAFYDPVNTVKTLKIMSSWSILPYFSISTTAFVESSEGENDHWNYFVINLHAIYVAVVLFEPAFLGSAVLELLTARVPSRAPDISPGIKCVPGHL